MGSNFVDIEREDVLYTKVDTSTFGVIYKGYNPDFNANDTDTTWQVSREVYLANGISILEYANLGKRNVAWSDKENAGNYINAIPAANLRGNALVHDVLNTSLTSTQVVLAAGTWTPLPATPQAGRAALNLQNNSGIEIYLNGNNAAIGLVGTRLFPGENRFYRIGSGLILYAKPATGTPTIDIEEIV